MESSPQLNPAIELKPLIEGLSCRTHNRHPVLQVMDNGIINISCCCPAFKAQCLHILNKFIKLNKGNSYR
jgi:hypothetical protein